MRCASALVVGTSPGSDQRLTEAKIQGARNFTNKLWNAARFVIGARPEPLAEPAGEPGLAERWIASRLADATARATRQLDELDVSAYAGGLYDFAWSDYCDWFLEMAKLELRREGATRRGAVARLVVGGAHAGSPPAAPAAPDPAVRDGGDLEPAARRRSGAHRWRAAAHPAPAGHRPANADPAVDAQVADLIELVRGVRNLRSDSRRARRRVDPAGGRACRRISGP